MKSQIEVLLQVARTLDELQVPYVVVGSVASSMLGFSRTTADADIVADLRAEHVAPLFAALKETFYIDDQMALRAVQNRRSFNVIHSDTLFKIDLYIPADEFSRQQLTRGQRMTLLPEAAQTICLAAPEDIILSKLRWYRLGGGASERQLTDVVGIIKVQGERLDADYLREWADHLNVSDLLKRAFAEASNS